MTRKRLILLLTSAALALVGMFVIVAFVQSAEDRALEGTELVPVLVASAEIDANTPATDIAGQVTTTDVPMRLRQPDAVRDLGNLEGQVTVSPVRAGEQIVQRQFGEPSDAPGSGDGIPKGKEIVSIALEPQRAVGGTLSPGDLVSVIVSVGEAEVQDETDPNVTRTTDSTTGQVLSNIRVASVTGGVTDESGEAADLVMVSLEVDEIDAEKVVFGMEHGSVWLTRNGEDVDRPDARQRTPENIFRLGQGAS